MKYLHLFFKRISVLILFLLSIFIFTFESCESKQNKKLDPMEGVWELTHFYHTANGDTLIIDTKKTQHKIYLDGFVIWNVSPTSKTDEWHGFGTYSFSNDTITEKLTSMSNSMKSDNNTYIIPIELKKNIYKQINTYTANDTLYQNIEVYKKINP